MRPLWERLDLMERLTGVRRDEVTLPNIMRKVCLAEDVSVDELRGLSRVANVVDARRTYCYLARLAGYSFKAVASSIREGLDHAAVMHHCAKQEEFLDVSATERARVRAIAVTCDVELPPRYA